MGTPLGKSFARVLGIVNEFITESQNLVKGDLCILYQNVCQSSLLCKFIFWFLYINSPNEGTITFCHNFGHFPISPVQKWAARQRIQRWDIKVAPYPQLFVTYPEPTFHGSLSATETSNTSLPCEIWKFKILVTVNYYLYQKINLFYTKLSKTAEQSSEYVYHIISQEQLI